MSKKITFRTAQAMANNMFSSLCFATVEDILQDAWYAYLQCGSKTRLALRRKLIDAYRSYSVVVNGERVMKESLLMPSADDMNDWPAGDDERSSRLSRDEVSPVRFDRSMRRYDLPAPIDFLEWLEKCDYVNERSKHFIRMRYAGMSNDEIALRLQCTKRYVVSLVTHAIARLREYRKRTEA